MGPLDFGANLELLAAMDFRNVLLVFILSLSLFACQGTKDQGAFLESGGDGIISGTPVKSEDSAKDSVVLVLGPDTGRMNRTTSDFTTCTGVLVAENVVLTAAHCVTPLKSQVPLFLHKVLPDLGVIAFASEPSSQRRITRFLIHEQYRGQIWQQVPGGYRPQVDADLALVYFEGARPSSTRLATLNKNNPDLFFHADVPVDLYGYGYQRFDASEVHARAQEVRQGRDAFIKNQPLLMTAKKTQQTTVTDGLFLDQRGSSGICYGDSGGPAFVAGSQGPVLVGIHSHRTGLFLDAEGKQPAEEIANDCQYESFVTRVDAYRPWIERHTSLLMNASAGTLLPVFKEAVQEMKSFAAVPAADLQSASLQALNAKIQQARLSLETKLYGLGHPKTAWSKEAFVQWLSLEMGWVVARDAWGLQEEFFPGVPTWAPLASLRTFAATRDLEMSFVVIARSRSEDFRREMWAFDKATGEILLVREIVTGE